MQGKCPRTECVQDIDFRTSGQFDGSLCIGGKAVEVTDTFKYLGITLDNKLTFGPMFKVYTKSA